MVVQAEMRSCTEQVQKLNMEVDELRQQLCASKDELHSTRCALRDVTNEKIALKKQRDIAKRRRDMAEKRTFALEEDILQLQEENVDLSIAISDVEKELTVASIGAHPTSDVYVDFSIRECTSTL